MSPGTLFAAIGSEDEAADIAGAALAEKLTGMFDMPATDADTRKTVDVFEFNSLRALEVRYLMAKDMKVETAESYNPFQSSEARLRVNIGVLLT